jgi:hypothetical protein
MSNTNTTKYTGCATLREIGKTLAELAVECIRACMACAEWREEITGTYTPEGEDLDLCLRRAYAAAEKMLGARDWDIRENDFGGPIVHVATLADGSILAADYASMEVWAEPAPNPNQMAMSI